MSFTKDDVGPYKNVNGEDVLMTDEERQATADKWNADAARGPAQLLTPLMILNDPAQVAVLKAMLSGTA